ncbi:MAG TPA: sulfurtransferase [Candidatus Binataceae bacterium]|nr:sulfurtransferase [Candidatus Binataceae bacterium]
MAENTIRYHDPEALVQTDWLEAHRGDANLRIFDCTTHLLPAEADTDAPYRIVSGKAEYDAAHIPGAGFIDLQRELSDNTTKLRFMLPSAEQFAAVMSRCGVGEGTRVVLYSADGIMWATRVWWMLRAFGFDNAAVLDGGWEKWQAEGRPVSTAACGYPPANFVARPRPELFVGKEQVRAALADTGTVIVNALPPELHRGAGPSRYGRPGRVPGSVNVPAGRLLDRNTKTFVPLADASAKFSAAGVESSKNVICYCGGGISATVDLFLLYQLGYKHLTLYDGSMGEWARDNSLPIETDQGR